ncbi:DUF418 domain-containing protein [Mucilaginibacter sp. BJC16-A38]|uniref:DUF418 domain-containing protein n=1 Tax=Mucilaginibacter phenanthrenivorans TaxID=1234842 RepID=UPI0021578EDD|nr:DUF418 domain-containing protein [Mucilaginibacter phenanthrenivorans]MCR8558000.1 DUF418 domain-containing protein [Mucilaginibacter phenanthrenivorans]
MPETDFKPIAPGNRIPIIDILRGWALLGVVVMNYADFYLVGMGDNPKLDSASNALMTVLNFVFASKSWTLLSFLFGYGFSVIMQNSRVKNVNGNMFFLKRMFWLFVLAFIDSAFFFGDILKDYAFLGLVLLLFSNFTAKTSLYTSAVIFLLIPVVTSLVTRLYGNPGMGLFTPYLHLYAGHSIPDIFWFGLIGTWKGQIINLNCTGTVHTVMFCCFLLGQAAQKAAFFEKMEQNKPVIKKIWLGSLFLSFIAIALNIAFTKPAFITNYFNPDYWEVLFIMIFTAASICLLYMAGKLRSFFISLQAIGKMTLTNYIVQNLISIFLFSGLGFGLALTHKLLLPYYYMLGLLVYILQVYFSKWWLGRFYYGPIEWLWRQLSYGKRLGIKIKR